MKKKDLICFDLDGTLVSSIEAHEKSYMTAFKENNLKLPTKKKLLSLFGLGAEEIILKLYPKISKRKLEKVVQDLLEAHEKSKNLIKQLPYVVEALVKLKSHFKIGIVSNNHHEAIMEILEYAQIPHKLFDVIVGEDDAAAKPSPKEILLAEKLTKANAKYMVGDTIYDIKAGKKANCKTIGVLTGVHNMEQLMTASPDILASSVAILPDILINK
jgi:HAD superfamily hydrolase (TIGR01549 family)